MTTIPSLRNAGVADAAVVADLLDHFNREYEAPTPGPAVLAARLERLLSSSTVVALLAGEPVVGLALLTLRSNVWYDGSVALLDELYVVPGERRRGIGTALLRPAINAIQPSGRPRGLTQVSTAACSGRASRQEHNASEQRRRRPDQKAPAHLQSAQFRNSSSTSRYASRVQSGSWSRGPAQTFV